MLGPSEHEADVLSLVRMWVQQVGTVQQLCQVQSELLPGCCLAARLNNSQVNLDATLMCDCAVRKMLSGLCFLLQSTVNSDLIDPPESHYTANHQPPHVNNGAAFQTSPQPISCRSQLSSLCASERLGDQSGRGHRVGWSWF